MPSSYPSGYDSLPTSWQGTDYQSTVDHAGTHNRLAEAVMAIQQELGLSPSDSWATVRARLDAMASAAPTAHKASHAAGGADALTPADIGAVPASVATTRGDLLVHNGTAVVREPVGADGLVLVADTAQPTGLRWAPQTGQLTGSGSPVGVVTPSFAGQLYADTASGGKLWVATGTTASAWQPVTDWASQGNLLSSNVATGTDTLGTTEGVATSIATVESSLDQAYRGARSLKVTTSGITGRAIFGGNSSSGSIPVVPGRPYTATARVRAGSVAGTPATGGVRIYWWTAAGNVAASSPMAGPTATGQTATWEESSLTAVAPADAAYASMAWVRTSGGTVGDTYYLDEIGFWAGAGGLWVPPGVPVPHLGTWITESSTSGRACYAWDQINSRPQMVYYDSGWRDISSLLVNGWTGSLFVRRADNMVMLRGSGLSGAAATSDTLATLPSGFRSESTIHQIMPGNGADTTVVRAQMLGTGQVSINPRASATAVSATWSMSTTNALPATLPGVASGTIPAA